MSFQPSDGPCFLLRHGETLWNRERRLQGRFDSPLTARGQGQARAQGKLLAQVFARYPQSEIWCSPLGRAQHTAEIALAPHNRNAQTVDDLREISAGSWDGCFLENIAQSDAPLYEQARNAFELMFMAPDGDGLDATIERADRILSGITGPTVIITHGATLCVLRGRLLGLSLDDMMDLSHEQGCIYALQGGQEMILRES